MSIDDCRKAAAALLCVLLFPLSAALAQSGDNQPPQIDSEPMPIATVDRDYVYLVEAGDPDGDRLQFALQLAPEGATLDPNSGRLHWRPRAELLGVHAFVLRVEDGRGGVAEQTFELRVLEDFCPIYPIALPDDRVRNLEPGDRLDQLERGTGPGNFSWLTWAGDNDAPTLATSLLPPGDSDSYVNPDDSSDDLLEIGQWTQGAPGSMNAAAVRDRLDAVKAHDIVLPVWDVARDRGSRFDYRVASFAIVRLLDYQLTGQGWLSFEYRGPARCYNHRPSAENASVETDEDVPAAIALQAGDIDGDALTYHVVEPPQHGTLSGEGADLTYTPDRDWNGEDRLVFKANDGEYDSDPATVTITVHPVNDAPVAHDQHRTLRQGESIEIVLTGEDVDGDALTFRIVEEPTHGSLGGAAPQLTYTPAAAFAGEDAFRFVAFDGELESAVATISLDALQVNGPPRIISDPPGAVAEGAVYRYRLEATDPDSDPLAFTLPEGPESSSIDAVTGDLQWMPPSHWVSGVRAPNLACQNTFPDGPAVGLADLALFDLRLDETDGIAVKLLVVNRGLAPTDAPASVRIYNGDPDAGGTLLGTLDVPALAAGEELAIALTDLAANAISTDLYARIDEDNAIVECDDANNGTAAAYFVVRATDPGALYDTQRFTVTVENVNEAPSITTDALPNGIAGQPYRAQIDATDPDLGDGLRFELIDPPSGMRIEPVTGEISWLPTELQIGQQIAAVKVTDLEGLSDQRSYALTIARPVENRAPVADSQVLSTDENLALEISLTGSDPDNDVLTFQVLAGPSHGRLFGTAPNLTYAPQAYFEGTDSFTFRTADGLLYSEPATVTINVSTLNNPPKITSDPVTRHVLQTNPESATPLRLTGWEFVGFYSATQTSSWAFLDDGFLAYHQHNAPFSGLIGDFDAAFTHIEGSFHTDNADDDLLGFIVGYQNEKQFYNFTWKKNAQGSMRRGMAFIRFDLPPGVYPDYFNYSNNGAVLFSNDVPWNQNVHYRYTVDFVPGELRVAVLADQAVVEAFIVRDEHYADGRFGVWNHSQPRSSYRVAVGSLAAGRNVYWYQVVAVDPDGDSITYSLDEAPENVWINPATGTIRWEVGPEQAGGHDIIVRATDSHGAYTRQVYRLVVAADGPAIISTPVELAYSNERYIYPVAAFDPDPAERLTYTLDAAPSGMQIDASSGEIVWNPTTADLGTHEVSIVVTDSTGLTAQQTYTLRVISPAENGRPQFTSEPPLLARVGQLYSYRPEALDPDGDILQFGFPHSVPFHMQIFDGRTITWIPTADQVSQHTITVDVRDGKGGVAEQTFVITVEDIDGNQPPEIRSMPPSTAAYGVTYRYAVVAVDPDGDDLSYALDYSPAGMTISPGGEIEWLPSAEDHGFHSVVIRVEDGRGGSATQRYDLGVYESTNNRPPQITSTPTQQITAGTPYVYEIVASDPDGDPLSYTLTMAPAGMQLDAARARIDWLPSDAQIGTHVVEVQVEDGRGASVTQRYDLHVNAATGNRAPVITSTPPASVLLGDRYHYHVLASDADGDTLHYRLIAAPAGMQLEATSGQLTWTPLPAQLGDHPVEVNVSDGRGASAAQSFTVTVQDGGGANRAPTITSTPPTAAKVGREYRYPASGFDADGDAIAWSLSTAPAGMTVDPADGDVRWTPNAAGPSAVSLRAADALEWREQHWTIEVVSADTALTGTLTITPQPVLPGQDLTITLSIEGAAGAVTVTASLNGEPIVLVPNATTLIAAPATPGLYTLVVTLDDGYEQTTLEQTFQVADPNDTTPPTVRLLTPADHPDHDAVEITAPTAVLAEVLGDDVARWVLAVQPRGESGALVLAEGTAEITGAEIASFDPTLLENGLYTLALQAWDASGNTAFDSRILRVDGAMKLGHFSITFEEVSIPVAGIPVTVTRSYDTRRAQQSLDFGYGWTVDANNVRLQESRRPGYAWDVYEQGGTFGERCIRAMGDPIVSVRLPDGELASFKGKAEPECRSVFDNNPYVALVFEPLAGTYHALEQADYGTLRWGNVQGYPVPILFDEASGDLTPADPRHYRLTTPEGVVYAIDQELGLRQVREPTGGHTLTFDRDGVQHSSGVGIDFERDPQGRIERMRLPDGTAIEYRYSAAGDLDAVIDQIAQETRFGYVTDPRWPHYLQDIIDPRGVRVSRNEYADDGRLLATIDADGQRVEYSHDIDGRTSVIKDRRGHSVVYVYDDHGRVLAETNLALGETILRSYDAVGNQLSQTDPLGRTTSWTYDARGNRLSETDPAGATTTSTYNDKTQLLTQTDPAGRVVVENVYDSRTGLLLTESRDALGHATAFGYVGGTGIFGSGQLEGITDAAGATTRFSYSHAGFTAAETDALGHTTSYVNDPLGRVLEARRSRTTAAGALETLVTRYTYDANGNLVASEHPDGSVTTTAYDPNGKPVEECDGLNRCTRTEYDARGNVARIEYPDGTAESKAYDPNGNLVAETDRGGRTTRFVYDAANRLVETIHPDAAGDDGDESNNPRSRTEYDAAGRVVAQVDRMGARTTFAYDAAGRRTATTDAEGHTVTTEYDASGRRTATVDADGHRTAFHYDAGGRLTETEFANGSRTHTEYDAVGRKTASVAQDGQRSEYGYDPLGRLTEVRQFIDGRTLTTRYRYDELGNKIEQVDALGRTTRWEFDAMGRETARILPNGERETKVYNAAGELVEATDFNGVTTRYSYDLGGRLLRADYFAAGSSVAARSETHGYEATGNRVSMASPEGSTTWAYDAEHRVIRETQPNGALIEYAFDGNGNRTLTRHTQGSEVTENRYTFDALNRLESAQVGNGVPTVYSYDAAGYLTEELQGSTRTAYAYDALHRLIEIHSTSGGAATQRYVYTLDAAGRRTRIEEIDATGITRVTDYGYDALGRLSSEVETVAGVETHRSAYAYDDVGNRVSITEDGITRTATFDDNDRLLTQGDHSYDYDANGSQTRKQSAEGVVDYLYDSRSKLIEASASSGLRVRFDYDAEGNRIARRVRPIATASEIETRFVIDRSFGLPELIAELDAAGQITARYLHGYHLIQQSETVGANSVLRYPLRDGLGSSRYLVDDAGSVTDAIRFTSWGETRAHDGDAMLTHRFAGEAWEESLGLSYNRARWLDPSTGRFTQIDPFRGFETVPGSLHRYSYAANDPANQLDPSGLATSLAEVSFAPNVATTLALSTARVGVVNLGRVAANDALWTAAAGTGLSAGRAIGIGLLTSLALSADSQKRDRLIGVPIIVFGKEFSEHSQHIVDAQRGDGSNFSPAPFALNRFPGWSRGWYNRTPECDDIARGRFNLTRVCDEYPFASTRQGGPVNYVLDGVSLRLLDSGESDRTRNFIGSFYSRAVQARDGFSKESRFIALGIPGSKSFYTDRQGNVHYWSP